VVLVADATDSPSVEIVAKMTRVLLTTAGPYAKFGLPLVKVRRGWGEGEWGVREVR